MLRTSLAILLTGIATSAWAHQDGTLHSHPHLVISNESLAVLLLATAAVLGLGARRLLKGRRLTRSEWVRK